MGMKDFDLRQLRVLRAVLEERHVTRAAARLGMAQPAVSAVLARLCRGFGDPLLVRGTREMALTERGAALLPRLARVLDELDALGRPPEPFDPATARFDARVAAIDYLQATLVADALERVGREAPGVRLSIRPMEPARLADDLERGALDMALMPRGNAAEHLRSRVLSEERFICVLRCGHPVLEHGLDLDAYCALAHVLVSPTRGDFRGQVDRALEATGRSRHVRASVPSFFGALELVRRSDDVATVPARLASVLPDGLVALPPPLDVPTFTLALVWHERTQAEPGQAWLRQFFVRAGSGVGPG
jgi:DNA-binding transcriptional LysR family regulator